MTSEELDAIEARANAATPGPWTAEECGTNDFGVIVSPDGVVVWPAQGNVCWERDADPVFCAYARSDVPRLIAAARRLLAIEAAAEAWLLVGDPESEAPLREILTTDRIAALQRPMDVES